MGLFGNIGGMAATAMNRIKANQQTQPGAIGGVFGAARNAAMNRINNNQQQGGIGNALSAAQRGMSSMGMGGVNTNQPRTGVIGSALNAARIAATARGNQGIVPGNPGGMLGSIMRGRNIANQNQLTSTPINPNAFNTSTTGQVFQSSPTNGYVDPILSETPGVGTPIVQKKSSPLKQTMDSSVDPLTGQYIDPTMSQGLDPGTVDPMLDQEDTSLTQY